MVDMVGADMEDMEEVMEVTDGVDMADMEVAMEVTE